MPALSANMNCMLALLFGQRPVLTDANDHNCDTVNRRRTDQLKLASKETIVGHFTGVIIFNQIE